MVNTDSVTNPMPTPPVGCEAAVSADRHASNLQPTAKLGRYRIIRMIGKGGMGVVYEAEDELLGRRVALKFLPTAMTLRPHGIDRLFDEAQAAARLNHPHITAVFDIGHEDDFFFIVMELLNPRSLAAYIDAEGPLHWSEATRIILDCCAALQAAHGAGLIHRDIKPDNILCSPNGITKLVDFGLVKDLQKLRQNMAEDESVSGTPLYMSPEQCKNKQLDGRSDIYALGATYYTLLTGKPPFMAHGEPSLMLKHCRAAIPDPRELVPAIPEACVRVLKRATAKNPSDRYQTAEEMRVALAAALLDVTPPPFRFLVASTPSLQKLPLRVNPLRSTESVSRLQARMIAVEGIALPRSQTTHFRSARWRYLSVLAATTLMIYGMAALHTAGGSQEVKPLPTQVSKPFAPPIKVGIIYSASDSMAARTRPVIDATLMAIDELNDQGGILGRKIEVITYGGTDAQSFAHAAERLITQDRVISLFGDWNPVGRKGIKPVVERYNHLFVSPGPDEGLEDSPNILYSGSIVTQQASQALRYCLDKLDSRRFYLIGTENVSTRLIQTALTDEIKAHGGSVVGRRSLRPNATALAAVVKKIIASKPDMIISTLTGDASVAFYRALHAADLSARKMPTLSLVADESILAQLDGIDLSGHYLAASYFRSIATPENRSFVQRFKKHYGPYLSTTDAMESAYTGVHLWAQALRLSGTEDLQRLRQALRRQSFNAPSGLVRIDPSNNHTWRTFRLAKILPGNSLEIIQATVAPMQPIPFPYTRTREQWEAWLSSARTSHSKKM